MRTAWCIDCSGSVSDAQKKWALALCKEKGQETDVVVWFDAHVQSVISLGLDATPFLQSLSAKGGGGTCFRQVFSLLPNLGVSRCIVLTDGMMPHLDELQAWGIEPEMMPGVQASEKPGVQATYVQDGLYSVTVDGKASYWSIRRVAGKWAGRPHKSSVWRVLLQGADEPVFRAINLQAAVNWIASTYHDNVRD